MSQDILNLKHRASPHENQNLEPTAIDTISANLNTLLFLESKYRRKLNILVRNESFGRFPALWLSSKPCTSNPWETTIDR